MAKLKQAKSEAEIKTLTIAKVRKEYNTLAEDYMDIINQKYLLCPKCNEYKLANSPSEGTLLNFYRDTRFATGFFPVCKSCLKLMAEQRTSHREKSKECKESVQRVLRFMNRPYIDSWYENCVKNVNDRNAENGVFDEHPSAFGTYMRGLNSLPNFKNYVSWEDSDFGDITSIDDEIVEDTKIVKSTLKEGRKRFGASFTDEEIMFLENEYKDWIARHEIGTKAQELIIESIVLNLLQRNKAIKAGKPTKDYDKAIQDYMDSGNLKPKQNNMDAFSDAQTMGTLLQRYEETRPLPKLEPSHEDVEHWGLYIDAFFRGHSCKMFGLKNRFSDIYEKVMAKYTATLPEYQDEKDVETVFDRIFGSEKEV